MVYYSQSGQDTFLNDTVFKGHLNGTFCDVGAHNGVTFNNTLFFEKEHNWTGINVEPIKTVYDELIVNRPNCTNLNLAVCNSDGTAEFICNTGWTEMLSGLKSEYDPRHSNRLNNEIKQHGGTTNVISVNTKKLETIFSDSGVTNINYLSIDVEGGEYEVIKSINFEKVFIDVIGFENNYGDVTITKYLEGKNYKVLLKSNDIFMIHNNSVFN